MLSVTNSTISGNTALDWGGGITNYGTTSVTDSIISNNTAVYGGGIYSEDGTISITNSTLSGNTAEAEGGGIYTDGTINITNSTISSNTANEWGGGISNYGSNTVSNSTISGNTAGYDGGGIYTEGTTTVTNSTITNNTADDDANDDGNGGGIFNGAADDATVTVKNTIIAGNFDKSSETLHADVSGNIVGDANNLVGDTTGGTGTLGTGTDIINPNPGLGTLQNNGGATQTHALLIGSAAINAGDNTDASTTDQQGKPRIVGGTIDIGAVESPFAPPKVNFGAPTYSTTEGSSAITVAIAVTLDGIPPTDVTVPIVINGSSTATTTDDYTFSPANVTFKAGVQGADLTQLITFTINPDDLPENAETVVLNFGTLKGAVAGTTTETTLTIAANDTIQYAVSTAIPNFTEGDSATKPVTFTVTRSGGIGVESTVDYTIGGTATNGIDYNNILVTGGTTALSGTLSFGIGETTKTINLDVLGDTIFEQDETINVTLSKPNLTLAPASSTITTGTAQVTVINDDAKPTVSITPATVTQSEGNGVTAYTFTVSLSNPSDQPISVNYTTNNGTATTADGDYTDNDGILSFNPGEPLTKTITVNVKGDNKFEKDETFSVKLNNATNATVNPEANASTAIITNDDSQPIVSIAPATVTQSEGNTGTTAYTFTVSLSNPSDQPITVNYSTNDGTAATTDGDYTDNDGILTFNPGDPLTKTITVNATGDNKFEKDETFSVKLNSATNANLGNTTATGIIKNDDTPGFTISPISGNTTEAGGTATFTVKLNSQPTANVTLGLTSSDTSEGTVSSPSLTFTANNWNVAQTVTVKGVDDALVDGNIAYNIVTAPAVSTDANYNQLNPGDVAVTNIDNDAAGFTITPISGNTTEAGGTANFTVKLNSQPTANVTLGLGSSDTTEGIVFTSSLTFTPNNWNVAQSVTVKGVNDPDVDGNIAYKIITAPAVSADLKYNGLKPNDVAVVNIDDDTALMPILNGTSISDSLVATSLNERILGFGGHDTIIGGLGRDHIYGSDGNDTLIGDLNNNLLTGGSMGMDDLIYGGTGNDRINGCGGNDYLYGESGDDQIWGDGGDDRLYGGLGNDILTGGLGRDIFAVSKGEGTDTIRDFQIGQDYIGLGGGLKLNQLSIIQQGSNTSIIDNSNNQTLAILAGVNAATFMSNAASTFVSI
nr:Calx-beta domain-containing protein [Coleofasciculus sp. FACHB-501]